MVDEKLHIISRILFDVRLNYSTFTFFIYNFGLFILFMTVFGFVFDCLFVI